MRLFVYINTTKMISVFVFKMLRIIMYRWMCR